MVVTNYSKHTLDEVLKYFSDGFQPRLENKGDKILRVEAFVDAPKNVVVFELIVEKAPDNRPG